MYMVHRFIKATYAKPLQSSSLRHPPWKGKHMFLSKGFLLPIFNFQRVITSPPLRCRPELDYFIAFIKKPCQAFFLHSRRFFLPLLKKDFFAFFASKYYAITQGGFLPFVICLY
jgi:hypothetical protein